MSPVPTPDANGFVYGSNTQVIDTPQARLDRAMADPWGTAAPRTDADAAPKLKGVANPYGSGLSSFEPNTTPYVAESTTSGTTPAASTVDMPQGVSSLSGLPEVGAANGKGTNPASFATGGIQDANGMVAKMVAAAVQLAHNNVPYVWGGTSATGVDCSGLIYYAAHAAGIKDWKRYRSVDYGRMGTAVTMDAARPGDVVFYDEGQGNGHVGIYLGNGMMVAAPQTGENVQVQRVYGQPTSIRRIFNDSSFSPTVTPSGGTTYSYNGRPMQTYGASGSAARPLTPPPAPPARVFQPVTHGNMMRR